MADVNAMGRWMISRATSSSAGVKVLLCEANARINEKLAKFGLLEQLGQADVQVGLVDVLAAAQPTPPEAHA